MRTITASSKRFTCITTFGHKVATACDDGTVEIYDSVTGVLRLSLCLEDPVQAIKGSPDGSMLFCAHKTPSITVWDIQTGGLIHTLELKQSAKDIGVSLKGRYLARGLSDGSVEVWEVADSMESGVIWACPPVTGFCWLDPEEQLAVSTTESVRICDIAARTVLHNYTHKILGFIHPMVYSQKIPQLAILASSTPDGSVKEATKAIVIINLQTGKFTTSEWIHQNISCFTFSQTADLLVCGTGTHGLQFLDVSTRRFNHFKYPETMTYVSSLQNGTVVANFAGSGIQLLSLDGGHEFQQPTISALTVYAFDEGKIIAIFPTSRDHILLLEPTFMSQLLTIPVRRVQLTPIDHTTILCASCENATAVYSFQRDNAWFLQLWRFHERAPRWTVKVDGMSMIGRISPTAARLVTFQTMDGLSRVCVWNAQNGKLDARLEDIPFPLDIEFTSNTKFCLHYVDHKRSHTLRSRGFDTRREEILPPSPRRLQKGRYLNVDDNHEWVVRGPKKICWIPPGYIGPTQCGYCWAGTSLVMIGRNGTLRSLTFSYDYLEG